MGEERDTDGDKVPVPVEIGILKDDEKDFIEKIDELLQKAVKSKLAIKALTVGTHGGNIISSALKPDMGINPKEMVAATTSMLFISSKAIVKIADDDFRHVVTFGPKYILICFLTRNVSFGAVLERKLVELDGIESYINELNEVALKISAIIETSDVVEGDVFSKIKVAIPDANVYAIVTKEGLPLKIQAEHIDEARIAAFISAIFNVNTLITSEDAEFTTVFGHDQSIIIHVLDEKRLLAISIESGDTSTIMKYIVKIKELLN
nr:hypothetical protein [Candidatus Sigynarchaeota archaeon]